MQDALYAFKELAYFPSIQDLVIVCNHSLGQQDGGAVANEIIRPCPNLEHLVISDFSFRKVDILGTLGTLRRLKN